MNEARKAAEEILNLIKTRLEEQIPFLQFHEVPQNDISRITAIIERHESAKVKRLRLIVEKMTEVNTHLCAIVNEIAKADLEKITEKEAAPCESSG